jgi:glycogen operon protein
LLLSQGVPMLLAGDEIGRTQQGNNNAYCQNSPLSWLDWPGLGPDGRELLAFTKRVIGLRRDHPVLRRSRFLHGRTSSTHGVRDILWFSPRGSEKTSDDWRDGHARCLGVAFNGGAGPDLTADGRPALDDLLLILVNANCHTVPFVLPTLPGGQGWRCLLDTVAGDGVPASELMVAMGQALPMPGPSLRLFALVAAADSPMEPPEPRRLAYQPPDPPDAEDDDDMPEGC